MKFVISVTVTTLKNLSESQTFHIMIHINTFGLLIG